MSGTKKVYPRTDTHPWVWPRYTYMRSTTLASSTPLVCPYSVSENHGTLSAADSVSYGENYANWRLRLKNGLATTTSLSGLKTIVRMPVGTYHWYNASANVYCMNGSGHGNFTGMKLSLFDPGIGANATADAHAKSKLLNTYYQAVNTWRGGNFLAEIGESLHMVLHPVKSIYTRTWDFAGNLGRLKRVYRIKPLDYSKALADAWLAYIFGVKPFVDDANDAFQALSRLGEGGRADVLNKLRGGGRFETIISRSTENVTPGGGAGDTYASDITTKATYKVRYIGSIRTAMEDASFQAVEFGVGLYDYAPAVWEGIPWSFLVDYFLNVQEVLDSFRFVQARPERLDLCVRNTGVVQVGRPYVSASNPAYRSNMTCGPAHSLVVRVHRTAIDEFPYIGFRFKFPGFPSLKWLNIAALWEQIKKSKP